MAQCHKVLRAYGKGAARNHSIAQKAQYCQAPDVCGVIWAHGEDWPGAGHLTQHCQMGFLSHIQVGEMQKPQPSLPSTSKATTEDYL